MRPQLGGSAAAAALVATLLAGAPLSSAGAGPARPEPLLTGAQLVKLANVFAGTDTNLKDQGTGGSAGNMSPAATAPFGMLSWGPRTVPDAVAYARNPPREKPLTAAMYGGLPRGVPEIQTMVRGVMTGMLDSFQDLPPASK